MSSSPSQRQQQPVDQKDQILGADKKIDVDVMQLVADIAGTIIATSGLDAEIARGFHAVALPFLVKIHERKIRGGR